MSAATTGYPPPTRVEGARHACADRCSATSWAAVSQCGRDTCHPFPPPQAPSSPLGFKNRVERDPNQASHAATN